MHLSDDILRKLDAGTLARPEAASLAAHLAAPCEACEAFLASRGRAGALDGAVDRALLGLAPPPATAAGHDLEFARIQRALRPASRARRWLPGLAVAAALAVAGLAGLRLARPPSPAGWDGEKGSAVQAVPLRLRFLVVTPAVGGPPTLERGLSGQDVPASASLQFQLELGRPAHVLLARAGRGGGAPEVFLSTRLPAGRHVVSVDGRPAAYPLAALAGPQRFLALASESPLGPQDAARAAALGAAARRDEGPPISLDQVEVRVRP